MHVHHADRAATRRRLELAWETFLVRGELDGVRPEIARSWRRARDVYGVDPSLRRAPVLPREELARRRDQSEALAVAAPVLDEFSTLLAHEGHVLALLDADGWMLSVGGDPAVLARVAEINLCPGARWREAETGTNGAGTSMTEGRALEVFASEHFVEAWQPWTSAGAPIFAPGCADPVGAIEITGPWDACDPQALVASTAIAGIIGERLRAEQSVRDEIVRYAMHAARASGDALLAVDARGRLVAANDSARRALGVDGILPWAAQEKLAARLRAANSPLDEELTFDWSGKGEEPRRIACSTVSHEGRAVGAVLRVLPAAGPRAVRGAARARAPSARYGFHDILGRSEELAAALDLARRAALNDLPLVIQGESGTGKELFAHAIHAHGPRADGRFVAVNCGAIPAPLVEAELFGYEAGTFTGAQREGRAGKLEEAHGGTLFLDEVSELSPQAQTALLRALQECEVVRLGSSSSRPVDVRVITATHRRLPDEVASGRFRQDLFFRLNVLCIEIPPLRDRGGDVELLAATFLAEAAARVHRQGLELSGAALEALARHPWPGNVRELRNVMMRAAAFAAGSVVSPRDLQLLEVRPPAGAAGATAGAQEPASSPCGAPGAGEHSDPEREELVAALDRSEWNIARTATALGVSRQSLYRRLRKFGITH